MSVRAALLITVIIGVIVAFPGLLGGSLGEFAAGLAVAGAGLIGYAAITLLGR